MWYSSKCNFERLVLDNLYTLLSFVDSVSMVSCWRQLLVFSPRCGHSAVAVHTNTICGLLWMPPVYGLLWMLPWLWSAVDAISLVCCGCYQPAIAVDVMSFCVLCILRGPQNDAMIKIENVNTVKWLLNIYHNAVWICKWNIILSLPCLRRSVLIINCKFYIACALCNCFMQNWLKHVSLH